MLLDAYARFTEETGKKEIAWIDFWDWLQKKKRQRENLEREHFFYKN